MRAGDVDAYWKATLDGLVLNGLLVDDNQHWAEIVPVEFERGAEKKTVIELEDID
jgi:Holliday junction resolvase RusA-like endonuclease